MLLPNTECKVVDAEGKALSANETGELCIKGPQVMVGYLNRPDATAETIDADGWLHTGDIATVDDDGFVTVVDRIKELIKVKGLQVAPAELEGLLLNDPRVADCAVIGVPDERAGEVPKAFVQRQSGHDDLTAEDVMRDVNKNVAEFKHIKSVEFLDAIPKSPSGKILRRLLRDMQ